MKTAYTILVVAVISGAITGCGNKFQTETEKIDALSSNAPLMMSKVDLNLHPMDKTVCDPFGGNTPATMEKGIKGSLFYRTDGMPRMYKAEDYINFTRKSDKALFFADMNVPTRMFSEGFSTQTTGVLSDDGGNRLIEYFGIKFETVLRLGPDDSEGEYELALLSDDGTRLRIKQGDVWKEIINNDGDHPTQMGCSTQVISLNRDSQLPIEAIYYQGPRYHIANVLMWRKSTTAGKDALCGKQGNEFYFNPNKNSAPLQPYKDLLARGWKPVSADNFYVTKDATYNPCVEGTKPILSDFRVQELILTDAFVTWKTDIPASSQVRFVNQATGEEFLTAADNGLRVSHEVRISGLKPGTTYKAQAVSISGDLGKNMSEEITFTTP